MICLRLYVSANVCKGADPKIMESPNTIFVCSHEKPERLQTAQLLVKWKVLRFSNFEPAQFSKLDCSAVFFTLGERITQIEVDSVRVELYFFLGIKHPGECYSLQFMPSSYISTTILS